MFLLASAYKGEEPNKTSSLMLPLLSKLEVSSSMWLPKLALSCGALLLLRKRFTRGMPTRSSEPFASVGPAEGSGKSCDPIQACARYNTQ
eukprot:67030-Chlamydomonas_euryale.AAC.1